MINVFQLKLQISHTFVFYTYKSFTSYLLFLLPYYSFTLLQSILQLNYHSMNYFSDLFDNIHVSRETLTGQVGTKNRDIPRKRGAVVRFKD